MMKRGCSLVTAALIALACLVAASHATTRVATAETLPAQLSDREFWKLVTDVSEPNGMFRSENLLSNEFWFQRALTRLTETARPGRAYLGVGPEQNFTYAAALRPAVSFVVDVRRGNLDLQLMYKALFEISTDRLDFVSRLFCRRRPAGLGPSSGPAEIFGAFATVNPSEDLYLVNLSAIRNQLVTRHAFALADEDLNGIEYVFRAFFSQGPSIRYSPFGIAGGTIQPTYAELMAATDESGKMRGFLADEATFAVVKELERRNLIVPIVGNFAGPKAIRAIGRYLRDTSTTVSAFYVSNVEEYLRQDGVWTAFCANVASLPLDATSTFIRSVRTSGPDGLGNGFTTELRPIVEDVRGCAPARP